MPRLRINNEIYDKLGDRWYTAEDDPVALLRAEGKLKNPWVITTIEKLLGIGACSVLDIGCGGGFLIAELEKAGHRVTGIDASRESIVTAMKHNPGMKAALLCMDAEKLDSLAERSFDVVCAMDFLEHVNDPQKIVASAARLLKPGGLFFFHTFNRNPLSWLIVIKGMEWFVRNTPARLHCYSMFIKPTELRKWCETAELDPVEWIGIRPKILNAGFFDLLRTGRVPREFEFTFSSSLSMGYAGVARKQI